MSVSEPAEYLEHHAVTRLDQLGLVKSDLSEAAHWGVNHLAYSTAHEPPSGPGQIIWIKTVRALRDKLVPRGWTTDDTDNYATVVSPDGSMAIAVAAGDERTGSPVGRTQQLRTAKGK